MSIASPSEATVFLYLQNNTNKWKIDSEQQISAVSFEFFSGPINHLESCKRRLEKSGKVQQIFCFMHQHSKWKKLREPVALWNFLTVKLRFSLHPGLGECHWKGMAPGSQRKEIRRKNTTNPLKLSTTGQYFSKMFCDKLGSVVANLKAFSDSKGQIHSVTLFRACSKVQESFSKTWPVSMLHKTAAYISIPKTHKFAYFNVSQLQ